MVNAFYRWDGFSYYASFAEFLPSVALASILWSFVSILTTIIVWMLFSLFEWFCSRIGFKIRVEHLLLYSGVFILLGVLVWKGKTQIWPYVQTTLAIKLGVFICVALLSIFLIWMFRNKAEQLIGILIERVTPLVWLFGIFVILSVPLVAYHTWWKQADKVEPHSTQSSEADKTRPNIILVTFDALTARNMSVYGYEKETTPFISEWARNATIFTMAEAESNFTTSATASLMTGKRIWTHQTFHIEGTNPVNSHVESLPALLKNHGYYNMAFVVNPHTSVQILGMTNSFDVAPLASDFSEPASLVGWQFGVLDVFLYRIFGNKIRMYDWILKEDFILKKLLYKISRDFSLTTVPPEKVYNAFLDVMDSGIKSPFFAWIHVFPPHDPFLPPEPYKHLFNPSSEFRSYKVQEQVKVESYKYLFQYLRFPDEMQLFIDLMRDYYDEFIRYSDKSFEKFIDELQQRNIENTIIILSADHGESFEHGYFTHGGPFLYEQVTHIPLIMKEPDQAEGQVVSNLVEQIDIPATILDLANIPVPSWMEGRSLVPLMRGEKLTGRHAFSMNFEENRSRGHEISRGSVAVWEGEYKLIHYLQKEESLLFNLSQDIDELNNIFYKEPETGKRLLRLIRENLKKVNEKIINGGHGDIKIN
jgi:arylsulfatase A-like enzyme